MVSLLFFRSLNLLGLFCFAAGGLLGAQRCTWGPSYWCSSLQNSAECSATHHCITKDWIHRQVPEDDDDVCTICKKMVEQARDTLESNETQMEIKEVFEGSCKFIPIKIVANECIDLADQFIPNLIETLASEMNPQVVCSVSGLCNSERIDKLLEEQLAQSYQTECSICRSQTDDFVKLVRETDPETIKDKMLISCSQFSSYSDACRLVVLENFSDIHSLLLNDDNKEICDLVGICAEDEAVSTAHAINTNDIPCEFCEKVIKHWKDVWTSNSTEEEFKTVLEHLCQKLSGPRVEQCLKIVDDYYIPWFYYILNEMDPHIVCTTFGLCRSSSPFEISNEDSIFILTGLNDQPSSYSSFPAIRLRPATKIDSESAIIDSNSDAYESFPAFRLRPAIKIDAAFGDVQDNECIFCEFSAKMLEDLITDKKDVQQIKHALYYLCDHLPSHLTKRCDSFVEDYYDELVQLIVNDYPPKELCRELGFCTEAQVGDLSLPLGPAISSDIDEFGDNKCLLCQYVMTTLENLIVDKKNEEEIKKKLDSLCSHLANPWKDHCVSLVESYYDQIVHMIINSYSPNEICQELRLCPDLQTSKTDILCLYSINTVYAILESTESPRKVKNALNKVCERLPQSLFLKCRDIISSHEESLVPLIQNKDKPSRICSYLRSQPPSIQEILYDDISFSCNFCQEALNVLGPVEPQELMDAARVICNNSPYPYSNSCPTEIVYMVENGWETEKICTKIRHCPYLAKNEISIHPNEVQEDEDNSLDYSRVYQKPFCVVCKTLVEFLETKMFTNRTIDMTERGIQLMCSYFPDSLAEMCYEFVDEYGDDIIAQLKIGLSAELCSLITVCPPESIPLLGSKQCTFGPAYWCSSEGNAESCGMTEYCKVNGWI